MKNLSFVLSILLLWSVCSKAQVVTNASNQKTETTSLTKADKSRVVFCNYQSDTLTYDQFKKCHDINVMDNPIKEVTSFILVCRMNVNDIYEFTGKGSSIPMEAIEKMIAGGVTHFWLENLTAKNDDGTFDLGTRKFYLKK